MDGCGAGEVKGGGSALSVPECARTSPAYRDRLPPDGRFVCLFRGWVGKSYVRFRG